MTLLGGTTGRVLTRPVLALAALTAAAGLALAAVRGVSGSARGAFAEPNPAWVAPAESTAGSVRHLHQAEAAELLRPDTVFPERAVRLLWFDGRAASPVEGRDAVVLDGAGGVVRFDTRLIPHRVNLRLEGRVPASVAAATGGGAWVVDGEGQVLRTGPDGGIEQMVAGPFDYPAVVADPRGGAWLVRSTEFFSYRLARGDESLLVYVDEAGGEATATASILLPEHVLLAELANAGHVAVGPDAVYFAPFIRDEVIALSRGGDTLWVAHRGLAQARPEPRFEIGPDGPVIDYAPVNLGLSLGPDGLLYVLSVPGFTTMESRVDVYDPATGVLKRTARLPTPLPTVALDETGRLYLLDSFRLLTGVAPAEREAFAAFELEVLGGDDRMALADVEGKVALVNFWASWCAPCRVEMPALDSLQRSIVHSDFMFFTMNEDVDAGQARAFIEERGFTFPVLLGRGKLQRRYHYMGLPFTVLLDREGRVVQRWIGFAGGDQIAGIKAVIQAELLREGSAGHADHSGSAATMEHTGH